jgi:alkylation response protein AidB-like acyl-CoA dehydrogenase
VNVLLDEDEELIKNAAREVLSAKSPPGLARSMEKDELGYSPELWKLMAQLGWLGLGLPECYGGQGLPLHFWGLVGRELGRHVTPSPFHSTVVAAALLARYGSAEVKGRLLPAVVEGRSIATFALQEPSGRVDLKSIEMTGEMVGEHLVLNGTKSFVDNMTISDWMLVAFRKKVSPGGPADSLGVALVETDRAGISSIPLVTTAKDKQSKVRFDDVRIPEDHLLGGVDGGSHIARDLLDTAVALLCAQLAGATRRDMEIGVEYSKQRVAFGRPIGGFQAIQHLAADMLIATDAVDLLTFEALWRLGAGLPASVEVSQAKSFASEHCIAVARGSQQIYGGMGFMLECDLQLWYRRIVAWCLRLGSSYEHRQRISSALLDRKGLIRLGDTVELDQETPVVNYAQEGQRR